MRSQTNWEKRAREDKQRSIIIPCCFVGDFNSFNRRCDDWSFNLRSRDNVGLIIAMFSNGKSQKNSTKNEENR